jgi:hypothetical protein
MKRLKQLVLEVFVVSDKLYAEAACCATVLGWAYILLVTNPDLFIVSPAYVPMNNTLPQVAWGLLFLLSGACSLVGLFKDKYWLRVIGSAISTFLWTWVAVSFKLTGSVPTGILVYSVLAFTSSVVCISNAYKAIGHKPKVRAAHDGSE